MRLGRDVVPDGDRRHPRAGLDDLAAQLMADDARRVDTALGPFVPAVDVVIGPAEGRGQDPHDHLPRAGRRLGNVQQLQPRGRLRLDQRSEEHTSELQSRLHLVCRLLLEKKKKKDQRQVPVATKITTKVRAATTYEAKAHITPT